MSTSLKNTQKNQVFFRRSSLERKILKYWSYKQQIISDNHIDSLQACKQSTNLPILIQSKYRYCNDNPLSDFILMIGLLSLEHGENFQLISLKEIVLVDFY